MVSDWVAWRGLSMDFPDLDAIDDPTSGLNSDTLDYMKRLGVERPGDLGQGHNIRQQPAAWDGVRGNPEALFDLIAVEKSRHQDWDGEGRAGLAPLLEAFPDTKSRRTTPQLNGNHPPPAQEYQDGHHKARHRAATDSGKKSETYSEPLPLSGKHDNQCRTPGPLEQTPKVKKGPGKTLINLFGKLPKKSLDKKPSTQAKELTGSPVVKGQLEVKEHYDLTEVNGHPLKIRNSSQEYSEIDNVGAMSKSRRQGGQRRQRAALNSSTSSADSTSTNGIMDILLQDSTLNLDSVPPQGVLITPTVTARRRHWNGHLSSPGVFGVHPPAENSANESGILSACVVMDALTQTEQCPPSTPPSASTPPAATDTGGSRDHLQSRDMANGELSDGLLDYTNPIMKAASQGDERALAGSELARGLRDATGNTPMHVSALGGHVGCVALMYRKQPAWLGVENRDKLTPAAVAIKAGQTEVLEWLLGNTPVGADLTCRRSKRPLLHHAAKFGQDSCLRLLLERIQTEGEGASGLDVYGNTPAHIAAKYGQLTCLQTLAEFGVDMTEANEYGQTPCYYADFANHRQCVGYLLLIEHFLSLARKLARLEQDTGPRGPRPHGETNNDTKVTALRMMTNLFKESREQLLVYRTQGAHTQKVTSERSRSQVFRTSSSSAFRPVQDHGSGGSTKAPPAARPPLPPDSLARLAVRVHPDGFPARPDTRDEPSPPARTPDEQPWTTEEGDARRQEVVESVGAPVHDKVEEDINKNNSATSASQDGGLCAAGGLAPEVMHMTSSDSSEAELEILLPPEETFNEAQALGCQADPVAGGPPASLTAMSCRADPVAGGHPASLTAMGCQADPVAGGHPASLTAMGCQADPVAGGHPASLTAMGCQADPVAGGPPASPTAMGCQAYPVAGGHPASLTVMDERLPATCWANSAESAGGDDVVMSMALTGIPSYTELPQAAAYEPLPVGFEPQLTSSTNSSAVVREIIRRAGPAGQRLTSPQPTHPVDLSTFKGPAIGIHTTDRQARWTGETGADHVTRAVASDATGSEGDASLVIARLVENDQSELVFCDDSPTGEATRQQLGNAGTQHSATCPEDANTILCSSISSQSAERFDGWSEWETGSEGQLVTSPETRRGTDYSHCGISRLIGMAGPPTGNGTPIEKCPDGLAVEHPSVATTSLGSGLGSSHGATLSRGAWGTSGASRTTSVLSNDRIPVKLQLSEREFAETYTSRSLRRGANNPRGGGGGDGGGGRGDPCDTGLGHDKETRKKKNVHFQVPLSQEEVSRTVWSTRGRDGAWADGSPPQGHHTPQGPGGFVTDQVNQVAMPERAEANPDWESGCTSLDEFAVVKAPRGGIQRGIYEEHFTVL